jgi:hypothetical protein
MEGGMWSSGVDEPHSGSCFQGAREFGEQTLNLPPTAALSGTVTDCQVEKSSSLCTVGPQEQTYSWMLQIHPPSLRFSGHLSDSATPP